MTSVTGFDTMDTKTTFSHNHGTHTNNIDPDLHTDS